MVVASDGHHEPDFAHLYCPFCDMSFVSQAMNEERSRLQMPKAESWFVNYDRITTGYWVISRLDGGPKTYACASEKGLHDLIVHLTGREPSTFPLRDGLPAISGITITTGLHIYS